MKEFTNYELLTIQNGLNHELRYLHAKLNSEYHLYDKQRNEILEDIEYVKQLKEKIEWLLKA